MYKVLRLMIASKALVWPGSLWRELFDFFVFRLRFTDGRLYSNSIIAFPRPVLFATDPRRVILG